MARMSIIPGRLGITLPTAPKILMSDAERFIANMPGLIHYVDPGQLSADGRGRDLFSGSIITPQGSNSVTSSNADFNGKATLGVANGGSGISAAPGSVTKSYTVVTVARLATSRWDSPANSNLLLATTLSGFIGGLRITNVNQVALIPADGIASTNTLSVGDSPARNEVAIYCASLDYDTKQSAVAYNNGLNFQLVTHSTVRDPIATDQWNIAKNPFSGTTGFPGDVGLTLIFDRALHMPTYRPFLDDLMSILRGAYGLSA